MSADPAPRDYTSLEALPQPDLAAAAESLSAFRRGEWVSNEAVCDWILSWRTGEEVTRPRLGD